MSSARAHSSRRSEQLEVSLQWRRISIAIFRLSYLQGLCLARHFSGVTEQRARYRWRRLEDLKSSTIQSRLIGATVLPPTLSRSLHLIEAEGWRLAKRELLWAEREAFQINKLLGGRLRPEWLRRLVSSERAARRRLQRGGMLVRFAYRGRYGFDSALCSNIVTRAPARKAPSVTQRTLHIAARLESLLKQRDVTTLATLFAMRSQTDRAWLAARYRDATGREVTEDALRYMGRRDALVLGRIIATGPITCGELLYWAIAGLGTDERMILRLLRAVPEDRRDHLRAEFIEAWERFAPWYERPFRGILGQLDSRLWCECAGDTWCDLTRLLQGQAHSPDLLHERTGKVFKLLGWFSPEVDIFIKDLSQLESSVAIGHRTQPTPSFSGRSFEDLLFEHRREMCFLSQDFCRELKHATGAFLTNLIAAFVVVSSVFLLTLLDAPLLLLMVSAGALSIASRVFLKRILKGAGYHRDEIVGDFLLGLLDGVTLFLSRLLRQALVRVGTSLSTKLGLKSGLRRIVRRMSLMSVGDEVGLLTGHARRYPIPRAVRDSIDAHYN